LLFANNHSREFEAELPAALLPLCSMINGQGLPSLSHGKADHPLRGELYGFGSREVAPGKLEPTGRPAPLSSALEGATA